jgi:hypothetical protein
LRSRPAAWSRAGWTLPRPPPSWPTCPYPTVCARASCAHMGLPALTIGGGVPRPGLDQFVRSARRVAARGRTRCWWCRGVQTWGRRWPNVLRRPTWWCSSCCRTPAWSSRSTSLMAPSPCVRASRCHRPSARPVRPRIHAVRWHRPRAEASVGDAAADLPPTEVHSQTVSKERDDDPRAELDAFTAAADRPRLQRIAHVLGAALVPCWHRVHGGPSVALNWG